MISEQLNSAGWADMKILFFRNGNSAVFGHGQQMPDLQVPWIVLFIQHLEEHGVNPETCEITMPDGSRAHPFRTENGWNWRLS